MNLKHLTDQQLVVDLKNCAHQERLLLTQVLYHLKEFEVRKLYSALGYASLYDYACTELKYSTDQAYRRIQAMRLLKEIPEISNKIDSGSLSLSNISQVQRFFNETKTTTKEEKILVLKKIENKSVREVEKQLLQLSPIKPLPQEIKKQVSPTQVNVNFIMSEELEHKIEEVRSLLGPEGHKMTLSELVDQMANLSLQKLKEKKFGKFRVQNHLGEKIQHNYIATHKISAQSLTTQNNSSKNLDVKNGRYISAALKFHIWTRDKGRCTKCESKTNLNYDHLRPVALGGGTDSNNLRLLCFHCNQRSRIEARL